MKHKWRNTFFRGVENSSHQVCERCGAEKVKGSRFTPTYYLINGMPEHFPGNCITKKEAMKAIVDRTNEHQGDSCILVTLKCGFKVKFMIPDLSDAEYILRAKKLKKQKL